MEKRGFKLYIDGETVKNKFNEDIIVYDEPRKITEGRFEILTFTEKRMEKFTNFTKYKIRQQKREKRF